MKKPQTIIKTIKITKSNVPTYSKAIDGKLKIIFEDEKSFWETPRAINVN